VCPAGKTLTTTGHIRNGDLLAYLASVHDCRGCPLKPNCCPKTPQRKVLRSIYEPVRDVARTLAKTEAFAQSRSARMRSHYRTGLKWAIWVTSFRMRRVGIEIRRAQL
jgi:hypothetical protein